MTTTSTPTARTGPGKRKRRVGAAVTALAIAAPLVGAAITAPAAVAAPGDTCSINFVAVQDVTSSFSPQNLADTKNQLGSMFAGFEGLEIPATAGISSFGGSAPLLTAPRVLDQDISTASGNAALRATVAAYDFDDTRGGTPAFREGSASTNWADGLREGLANAQAQGADTIVFITDGVPNSYRLPDGSLSPSLPSGEWYSPDAANAAAEVVAEINAAGIKLAPIFIRTNQPEMHGLDDPIYPSSPEQVNSAMQVLQPGWTVDKAISISNLANQLRSDALTACDPSISLTKTHTEADITDVNGDGFTNAGDQVVFTFVAQNTGNIPLQNAIVTDEELSAAGVGLVNGGKLGSLAVGASGTVKSEPYTLTQADVDAGFFHNVATVKADSPKGPVTDEDDDKVPTDGTPGIKLEKSHDGEDITDVNGNSLVDAGDTVVFDLKASNTGHLTIENAVITDKMLADAGVKLEGDGKLGTIAVGQSTTIKSAPYTITQADVDNGGFTNVALVTGDTPKGPVKDDDDDEVPTDGTPGISIEKSHKPEAVVDANKNGVTDSGDTVVFDFDVKNTGNVTITEAIVTDEKLAAAGVELVDGGNVGALEVGASASTQSKPYTITQADVDAGTFVNVGKVTGDTPRGPVTDNDNDEVPTQPAPVPPAPASDGSSLATTGAQQAGIVAAVGAGVLALLGGGFFLALRNRRRRESAVTNAEAQN
ncbi:hypothetical protein C5E06_09835 [Pseudoclavibacter sp. RFBI5]|uniref:DUF7507 domain-containing protein n=1 Tax=Pseudoclavibacter sp. RFBI5 TaxID=2080578 RepID=UPI000CE8D30D|nr:LPXTG cell wall anchor domain-containing protein [Pseudoclavibacter sp. RFBI5]PPG02744.1 hypothetical protein C5E06_09835 [Pseudoclavibacter sp. RFBI5]